MDGGKIVGMEIGGSVDVIDGECVVGDFGCV